MWSVSVLQTTVGKLHIWSFLYTIFIKYSFRDPPSFLPLCFFIGNRYFMKQLLYFHHSPHRKLQMCFTFYAIVQTAVCVYLTQRDWSLMRLMKRGDSFVRRTSGDVELETIIKHSAQAFLMPHRLSEHRSKNLGICVQSKTKSELESNTEYLNSKRICT